MDDECDISDADVRASDVRLEDLLPQGCVLTLDSETGLTRVEVRQRTLDDVRVAQVRNLDMEVRKPADAADTDHVLEFVGSTESRDSYGDRISVKGWELTRYKKNPVFMPVHNYGVIPIGRALKVVKDTAAGALRFTIKFATDMEGAAGTSALEWYNAYKQKYVRGSSVGFLPLELRRPESPEEAEELGLGKYGFYFLKQELLELSAAPVPANPEALAQLSAAGMSVATLDAMIERKVYEVLSRAVDPDDTEDDPAEDHPALGDPDTQQRAATANTDRLRKLATAAAALADRT